MIFPALRNCSYHFSLKFFILRLIDFTFADLIEIFWESENQNNELKNTKPLHTDEGSCRVGAAPCGVIIKCT